MIRLISSNIASNIVTAITGIESGSGCIRSEGIARLHASVNFYDSSSMLFGADYSIYLLFKSVYYYDESSMLFNTNKEPLNE